MPMQGFVPVAPMLPTGYPGEVPQASADPADIPPKWARPPGTVPVIPVQASVQQWAAPTALTTSSPATYPGTLPYPQAVAPQMQMAPQQLQQFPAQPLQNMAIPYGTAPSGNTLNVVPGQPAAGVLVPPQATIQLQQYTVAQAAPAAADPGPPAQTPATAGQAQPPIPAQPQQQGTSNAPVAPPAVQSHPVQPQASAPPQPGAGVLIAPQAQQQQLQLQLQQLQAQQFQIQQQLQLQQQAQQLQLQQQSQPVPQAQGIVPVTPNAAAVPYATMPQQLAVPQQLAAPPAPVVPTAIPHRGAYVYGFDDDGTKPPPGTLGRTYQRPTRMIAWDKPPRVGMLDVEVLDSVRTGLAPDVKVKVTARDMYNNFKPLEGYLGDDKVWHFESEPLLPTVPHIYDITFELIRERTEYERRYGRLFEKVVEDKLGTLGVRRIRLIPGRIVDLVFY